MNLRDKECISHTGVPRAPRLRFAVVVALVFSSFTSAFAAQDEWILQQWGEQQGDVTAYVSHDAVKIVNAHWGFTVLAKAPKWTIYCFRPREKVEWIGNLKLFNGSMIQNPVVTGDANHDLVIPLEHGVMNGLKYRRYAMECNHRTDVLVADEISVAPEAAEFACRFYNVPNPGKYPIQRDRDRGPYQTPGGKADGWLKRLDYADDLRTGLVVEVSTKSWKKVPFNAADFAVPHGFKILSRLSELAYSNSRKEALNEIFNDVGFSSGGSTAKTNVPANRSK